MIEEYNYADNFHRLQKCKRTYGVLFVFYVASTILILTYSIFNLASMSLDYGFLAKNIPDKMMSPNYTLLLVDALAVAPLTLFFGFRICYYQHDLSALFGFALAAANLILFIVKKDWEFFSRAPVSFWTFVVYSAATLVACAIGFKTNYVFHKLEALPGYPHFNERLEEQKVKIDRFQCEYNRLKRTSTDKMEELPTLFDDDPS